EPEHAQPVADGDHDDPMLHQRFGVLVRVEEEVGSAVQMHHDWQLRALGGARGREHVEVQAVFAAFGGPQRHKLDAVRRERASFPDAWPGDHRLRWPPPVHPEGRCSVGDAPPLADGSVVDPVYGPRGSLDRQRIRGARWSRQADDGDSTYGNRESGPAHGSTLESVHPSPHRDRQPPNSTMIRPRYGDPPTVRAPHTASTGIVPPCQLTVKAK